MSDDPEVTIKIRENGPLLVRGAFRLVDHEGVELPTGDDIALCRCGRSATKPFCDGTHKQGFDGTCARQEG